MCLPNEPQGLYDGLIAAFPNASIWLTGHSLGGSLAALLGATFGVPTVTFERYVYSDMNLQKLI